MDLPPEELVFVRDLVKTARQRSLHVKWTDRDGSERLTVLTSAEAARLNGLAQRQKISKGELLRQAAHIPIAKIPIPPPA